MSNRNFWRNACAITVLAVTLLIGACTTQTGSLDENGLRPHLSVDLQIPEGLVLYENNQFIVNVAQDDKPITADQIHFEFWPEGRTEQLVALEGVKTGEGVYAVDYRLMENGIYVVRCRITSASLEVMPSKRFAIGEEAVLHLAASEVQDGLAESNHPAGGHHHH